MKCILITLGIFIFFEGIPYFLYPNGSKNIYRYVSKLSDDTLRIIGFTIMILGILLMYFAKWFL